MSNHILDIERVRALNSYIFTEKYCHDSETRSACLKLPAYILDNSLIEVLLFYKNNKEDIYDNINTYLIENDYYSTSAHGNDILKFLINEEDLYTHLLIKNEILKYSNWLKRNAECFMVADNND